MQPLQSAYAFDCVFIYPAGDRPIGRSLAMAGEFARAEVEFLGEQLPEDGVMFDIGANLGTVSIPIARHRPKARLFAFEAQPGIHHLLGRNVALNGLGNVQTFHCAVGESDGEIAFPAPPLTSVGNFGGVGRDAKVKQMGAVPMRRLDSLDLPPPNLIKIDVEGFDLEVVQGALGLLRRHKPVLFYEALRASKTAQLNTLLAGEGYRLFWFFAPYITPSNLRGVKLKNALRGDMNVAAFPDGIDPVWRLPQLRRPDEKAAERAGEYGYLKRFGYEPQPKK
ncbi:MAG TPA: FkbM family methyltransferase [Reyranellaceae bacterium]|nr:FkbM family methyltransferase [Reyranellaceae bacterium]